MAPYTMKIDVINRTSQDRAWNFGMSVIKMSDGCHNRDVRSLVCEPGGGSGTINVSKGGGTGGMFTALTWKLYHHHRNMTAQFGLWIMMPASAGGEVSVQVSDWSCESDDQYNNTVGADYCYNHGSPPYLADNEKSRDGIKARIERVTMAYPDSHCRIIFENA